MESVITFLLEVEQKLREVSTSLHSFRHGEPHWRSVAWTALSLAPAVEKCDPELAVWFALFHDSMRDREGDNEQHGARGAQLAVEMLGDYLSPERLALLEEACRNHSNAPVTKHPTLGLCYDSDRLNHCRFGVVPNPELLSTDVAKQAEWQAWVRDLQGYAPSWPDIIRRIPHVTRTDNCVGQA